MHIDECVIRLYKLTAGNWARGIECRMIKRVHDEKMCDGVHIMAIGKDELVPDIMAATGLD